jgi:hypothetical protein
MLRLLVGVEAFMKRAKEWLACSVLGVLAAAAMLSVSSVGCGSSTSGSDGGTGTDASTDTKGTTDHVTGMDAPGKDMGLPDMVAMDVPTEAAAPFCEEAGAGKQLLSITTGKIAPGSIQVIGLTADNNYLVYYAAPAGDAGESTNVYALPVTGSSATPVTIYTGLAVTMTTEGAATISQNTVFVWSEVNTSTFVGTLSAIWSSGATAATAVTGVTASAAGVAAASPNSANIVYSTSVNTTTGETGTLVGAAATAPTTTVTLLSSTAVAAGAATTPSFLPLYDFLSDTYFVASHQESGSATITVSEFNTTTWPTTNGKVDLLTGALAYDSTLPLPGFTTDTADDNIAAVSSAGQLELINVATGIAQNVGGASTTSWYYMPSGDGILYTDTSLNLWSAPITAGVVGTPVEVVTASGTVGAGGLYTLFGPLGASPNESQILFYKTFDKTTNGSDLWVVANAAASTPTQIVTGTGGAVFGDVFTADSNYALFVTGLANAGGSVEGSVGQLEAWDIAGAKTIDITTKPNVWDSNSQAGSIVLYNDNFTTVGTDIFGVADLKTVDVSAATLTPTLIQHFADQNYFLTSGKTAVYYTLNIACDTSAAGIYGYTFP